MSLETWKAKYPTIVHRQIQNRYIWETVRARQETQPKQYIWSARLSTGIFGLHDCKSGNNPHAPKGESEVMLAVGDFGLSGLIDLGFIPCPTCHPEDNTTDFWEKAKDAIQKKYPDLTDIRQFADKSVVPFDSRRVNWEELAPHLTALPNRLYVPEGLGDEDLRSIKLRFESMGFTLPPVGCYVNGAPWFKEYNIK